MAWQHTVYSSAEQKMMLNLHPVQVIKTIIYHFEEEEIGCVSWNTHSHQTTVSNSHFEPMRMSHPHSRVHNQTYNKISPYIHASHPQSTSTPSRCPLQIPFHSNSSSMKTRFPNIASKTIHKLLLLRNNPFPSHLSSPFSSSTLACFHHHNTFSSKLSSNVKTCKRSYLLSPFFHYNSLASSSNRTSTLPHYQNLCGGIGLQLDRHT